jgi:hypothetical protein
MVRNRQVAAQTGCTHPTVTALVRALPVIPSSR